MRIVVKGRGNDGLDRPNGQEKGTNKTAKVPWVFPGEKKWSGKEQG